MALTNYPLRTTICTTIFYGRSFGLYGWLSRVAQVGLMPGVWIVQLIFSPIR